MEWINIHRATLEHELLITCEPADGWTWLRLLGYCMGQENGGRIKDAKGWNARTWMRATKLDLEEVSRKSKLWRFEGDDLVIEFYPVQKEREVKAKRTGGKMGGRIRGNQIREFWRAQKQAEGNAEAKAMPQAELRTMGEAGGLAEGNPKGKVSVKRKGMEGNGMEGNCAAPPPDFAELPSDEEVLGFAHSWPGDMNRGIAGPVPEDWVLRWLSYNKNSASRFPRDWRKDLVMRYVADQVKNRGMLSGAAGTGGKRGTVTGSASNTDDIDAELQWQTDEKRREELMKKRASLTGTVCST